MASQIYVADDPYLETDSQFGVTRALIGDYVRHEGGGEAPDGAAVWWSLAQTFVLEPGESRLPKAPISGKAR